MENFLERQALGKRTATLRHKFIVTGKHTVSVCVTVIIIVMIIAKAIDLVTIICVVKFAGNVNVSATVIVTLQYCECQYNVHSIS